MSAGPRGVLLSSLPGRSIKSGLEPGGKLTVGEPAVLFSVEPSRQYLYNGYHAAWLGDIPL